MMSEMMFPTGNQEESAQTPGTSDDARGFEALVAEGLAVRWPGRQAVVVRAADEESSAAEMWLFEYHGGAWRAAAGPWPAMGGGNGYGKREEGDCRSPSGAFLLGTAIGIATRPKGMAYQYRVLDGADLWVDDSTSPFYNAWVRGPADVFGGGEKLKQIEQYEYAVAVHYNDERARGIGSAIFLHVWTGPNEATHGCTAVSRQHMQALMKWLDYSARPVLVQGTGEQIARLMAEDWGMLCLPEGWGFVDDFVPDAQLEIRYNTDNNFTGRRLAGYHASLAPMRLEAIEALAGVAEEFRSDRMGLRVYDAYRPQAASDAMIAWAADRADTSTKREYYPDIDKADIPNGYVARRSAHRLGGTVDLTLLDWRTGKDLDMGGPFDFFGEVSGYRFHSLTETQQAHRATLRNAMTRYGFQPYDREWWHFTYPVDGAGGDFAILPREYPLI